MEHIQRTASVTPGHYSTNGVLVDAERWERRKDDAADAVRNRLLTLREACEHYALPEQDVVTRLAARH